MTGQNPLSELRPKRPPIWVYGDPLVLEILLGPRYFLPDCLRKKRAARARRVGRGCPPPNQPHRIAPTGWAGGWMGRDAPPDAVIMPRPELNRPTGVKIQGVAQGGRDFRKVPDPPPLRVAKISKF